jgi:ribosomal protein L1
MPGAKRLLQRIEKYDPYILSAFTDRDSRSKGGKIKWVLKNTRIPKSRILVVKREQKQAYSTDKGQPSVLIDDYIKNIKEWENKGGIGVHHTDVSKTLNELSKLGFK